MSEQWQPPASGPWPHAQPVSEVQARGYESRPHLRFMKVVAGVGLAFVSSGFFVG